MSFFKNVAGQQVGAQLVFAANGNPFTGNAFVYVINQTLGFSTTHRQANKQGANGYYQYGPTAAETNANTVTFQFVTDSVNSAIGGSLGKAVPVAIQIAPVVQGSAADTTQAVEISSIQNDKITAASIATDAIGSAELAASAVTEIRSIVNGTADAGGSTTTLVDAALTEIDDTWNGSWLLLTSGTDANRVRLITDFDAATDTITFAPAVSASIGAGVTYEILPAAGVDVQSWIATESAHQAPNALVAGAVDADVSAIQASAITATSIATGAITAAKFAAGAIDAAALNVDAVDKIWDEPMTETTGAPSVTGSFRDAIKWMFALSRNKITQTSTTTTLRNDADSADLSTSTVSDNGTTYTRGEWSV